MTGRHAATCGHVRGRLVCVRAPHDSRGHVYHSAAGSHVADRHLEPDQEG